MSAFVRFGFGPDGELGLRFARKVWDDLSKAVAEKNFTVDENDGSIWIPLPKVSQASADDIQAGADPDSPPCPPFVELSLP